jgi:hypothetical protein
MKKLFFFLILSLIFNQNSFADIIPAPTCDKCDKSTETWSSFFEGRQSKNNALILWIPGGEGQGPSEIGFTPWRDLIFLVDFAILISPYPLKHPKSVSVKASSPDYINRIRDAIIYYKKKTGKKVILAGHSMSTRTVSNFINSTQENADLVDGAIYGGINYNVPLLKRRVNIPILMIHHKKDACPSNSLSAAKAIVKNIQKKNDGNTFFEIIEGGQGVGDVCGTQHYHGFGTVKNIAAEKALSFIENNFK